MLLSSCGGNTESEAETNERKERFRVQITPNGVDVIRNLLRYGIIPKGCMESIRRWIGFIRAARDAMRDFVAIPYNARAR